MCFEYNLPVHVSDNEADPRRRAFSRDEVQRLFDYFDTRVDELYAANKKAWLTTLRDACIAEVAYAYGVRRQELLWLQIHEFGPNPHVPQYGSFGAMYVRWGKGSRVPKPRAVGAETHARPRRDRYVRDDPAVVRQFRTRLRGLACAAANPDPATSGRWRHPSSRVSATAPGAGPTA